MVLTNAGEKRRLNVSQAREHLWISKLRRLPDGLFERAVKKLMSGVGPSAVAQWLVESRLESPEFRSLKFSTYKKYLCVLNMRLQAEMKGVPRSDVSGLARRAVQAEFERQTKAVMDGSATKVQPVKEIWNVVTKTVQQLDAELALRYSFAIQMERVEAMRAMEIKNPTLVVTGDGYKEITILKNIAAELVKLELKSSRARDKNGRFLPRVERTSMQKAETSQSASIDENLRATADINVLKEFTANH
jgi:hypothetical protein